tara:strand:+ start:687 stop:1364 length:678 start_codon:yes stop_codon:yes gene_type:complete
MAKETYNNESECTAKEYIDTTLRTSHYNQQQRVEDKGDSNGIKLDSIKLLGITNLITLIIAVVASFILSERKGIVENQNKFLKKQVSLEQHQKYALRKEIVIQRSEIEHMNDMNVGMVQTIATLSRQVANHNEHINKDIYLVSSEDFQKAIMHMGSTPNLDKKNEFVFIKNNLPIKQRDIINQQIDVLESRHGISLQEAVNDPNAINTFCKKNLLQNAMQETTSH